MLRCGVIFKGVIGEGHECLCYLENEDMLHVYCDVLLNKEKDTTITTETFTFECLGIEVQFHCWEKITSFKPTGSSQSFPVLMFKKPRVSLCIAERGLRALLHGAVVHFEGIGTDVDYKLTAHKNDHLISMNWR